MKFKKWIINEMPISNAQLVGNWKNWPVGKQQDQNYDKASFNILTNDPDFEKLKTKFSKTNQNFDVYFIKNRGMRDHIEVGEVSEDYLSNFNVNLPPINKSNITILFTNNRAAERMPLTPWTIAHRMGHAFNRLPTYQKFRKQVENDFNELLETIYGKQRPSTWGSVKQSSDHQSFIRQLMQSFGSMRSAREGELFREGEFLHELLAQYIIEGNIKFREEIPRQLIIRYAWGNPTYDGSTYSKIHQDESMMDYIIEKLRSNADYYNYLCEQVLNECVGKIFVM